MRELLKSNFAVLGLLLILASGPVHAAPSAAAPATAPATAPALPDYGGRDSASPAIAGGDVAPNPAAQAGRALEALVVVLAGVVGVVYALKRFGLVKSGVNGRPARISGPVFGRPGANEASPVTIVSSQALPGGSTLHVVRVADRNLLLAATAHTVTSVCEWPVESTEPESMSAEFADYLSRADPTSGIAAANARLRSLLSPQTEELS